MWKSSASITLCCEPEYLGNCVTPERDILECAVRDAHGDDINKTLNFMEDCVCKWEGFPVLHRRTALLSNRSVDLLLHILFRMRKTGRGSYSYSYSTITLLEKICNNLVMRLKENL